MAPYVNPHDPADDRDAYHAHRQHCHGQPRIPERLDGRLHELVPLFGHAHILPARDRHNRTEPAPSLRSTRETELADHLPAHVVSAWIASSVPVAARHDLQVTDEHFRQAARNAAQKPSAGGRNESKPAPPAERTDDVTSVPFEDLREHAALCEGPGNASNGRYRTRTCDLTGVIEIEPTRPMP